MSRYSEEKYFEISVKPTKEALPLSDNTIGDRYIVGDDVYIWNGNFWVEANLLDPPASLFIQTYNVSAVSNVVDEGDTLTINLTTTNIPDNTTLDYTITGTVSSADLSGASLTGTFTIVNNAASVVYTVASDLTTEGTETLIFSLDNGADSTTVTIGDTSTTPIAEYTLTPSVGTVDEGDSFTITLNTVNVPTGTVVPYTITGIQVADLEAPGETSLTGSFTIDAVGASQKSFNIKEDSSVDEGSETFLLTLNNGGDSISVTINDTSAIVSGSQVFTDHTGIQAGYQSFTVPSGVTELNIFAVGAGGGGSPGRYSYGSGAGGGGGGYVQVIGLTVTPGETFYFQIGRPGVAGYLSTNSPFETVNGTSQKYPQAGTEYGAVSGGNTVISYTGDPAYVNQNTYIIVANSGNGAGLSGSGAPGGTATLGSSTYVEDNATSYNTLTGSPGKSRLTDLKPGGGGGAGYAGDGGYGIGDFYRSNGGYNYYKASRGGIGGGQRLLGGNNGGSNGANAPGLYSSGNYNYTGAGNGTDGGTVGGDGYGGGGGGGAGGRIRDQTIISGGSNFQYRWFLGHSGSDGEQGGLRFSWGNG